MKLLKALLVLLLTLLQWGVVILNLNQYGIFQSFVEIEWYTEVHPKQEEHLPMEDPYEPNLFT